MLEGDSFDPLLLDVTASLGPNEDNTEQQPTTDPINSSVADPIFGYFLGFHMMPNNIALQMTQTCLSAFLVNLSPIFPRKFAHMPNSKT